EDRVAVVPRLERRELVGPLHHAVGELAEEPPALAGGHLAPRPFERRARRGDRRVDVLLARRADGRDDLLRRGVDHVHGPAAGGVAPLVVDQELLVIDRCRWHASYRPLNCGWRFSRFAAMPSLASSLWKSSCWSSRSIDSPSRNPASAPDCTARFIRPTARLALCGGVNVF